MSAAIDLIEKVVGILAALLGMAGYVLVLGAVIVWWRVNDVGLPPEVPISLASREELIAIGAQAVAVWLLMVVGFGSLTAWIVTGDPGRRHFGYAEAGLALAVAASTWLAVEKGVVILALAPIALSAAYAALRVAIFRPSLEAFASLALPMAVGGGIGAAFGALENRGELATGLGLALVFVGFSLVTPKLQRWRARLDANRSAVFQLEENEAAVAGGPLHQLLQELERGPGRRRSPAVTWIERAAVGAAALLILGTLSISSQIDRDENFHDVLVSLANGDCVKGTYIVRGGSQLVIGYPELDPPEGEEEKKKEKEEEEIRIATIPLEDVLDVQVYGAANRGTAIEDDRGCVENGREAVVRPAGAGKKE